VFQTGPTEQQQRITARLQPLRLVCGVLAGLVGICAVTAWMLVEGFGVRLAQEIPNVVPLSLTVFAMVLILLSSRLRTTLLRRAFPRNPSVEIDLETLLAAYQQATLVSFAVLTAAALLAIVVALTSGTVFYGIFLCLAAAIAMFTRWPSPIDADRLARGRRSP
jgi:H+/Cl- antiporter ClcA